jgi:hypothetical protein
MTSSLMCAAAKRQRTRFNDILTNLMEADRQSKTASQRVSGRGGELAVGVSLDTVFHGQLDFSSSGQLITSSKINKQ